jgi:PAS domain S-box-containing protein
MKTPLPPGFDTLEAFVEAFGQNAAGLVAYVDAEERMRFASQPFAKWFQTTREDLLGAKLSDIYSPEAYAQFAPYVKRALAGEDVHYERQAERPDGGTCWISVNLRPHRDRSGRVMGLFSCALEVEELKRTHDALGRALEEIATHIQNTPLAVVEWSADIRVKRWSPQAQAIFGWTTGEVLGKTSVEIGLVHPESLPNVRALTRDLVEGNTRRNRMLARNFTRDGKVIWCEWYNSAFFEDDKLSSILSFAEGRHRARGCRGAAAPGRGQRRAHGAAEPQLARRAPGARHRAREPQRGPHRAPLHRPRPLQEGERHARARRRRRGAAPDRRAHPRVRARGRYRGARRRRRIRRAARDRRASRHARHHRRPRARGLRAALRLAGRLPCTAARASA